MGAVTAPRRPYTLRQKLLALVLVPLAVVLPLLGLALLLWGSEAFDRLLEAKVRADLAVARGYFERVQADAGAGIAAVAESHALQRALTDPRAASRADPRADWPALLAEFRRRHGLDFVNLRAPDGTLLVTDSGWAADTRTLPAAAPGFSSAEDTSQRSTIEVLGPHDLARLAPALLDRVPVKLVDTRNAAPSARTEEDRAMVLLATQTVRAPDGRVLGRVQGGVLLNRNLGFIDRLNEIVYPEGSLPYASRGTATLFLDDVRISTNVRLFGTAGEARAIGTRVSREVRDAVLGQGRTWLGRAFVVNDWYVSAYMPLSDGRGERIGMLYVGVLERPFTALKYTALAGIGVICFAVMIGAALVSARSARTIFKPIERMDRTMERVEGGEWAARVGPVGTGDELGKLAGHLDRLLATLERWHVELDAKVAERTAALETAQRQLVRSEQLATVGQLTASIAHEVNNPIAVIQGNLDLLRELLPADALAAVKPELKLVDEQIERMRLIVAQLLQFSRPAEYAGTVQPVPTGPALDGCLVLVGHLTARTRIAVQRDYRATRPAAVNRQELQQVLVNLLVNAVHAMADGGTLWLSTADAVDAEGGPAVEIRVGDTGPGLPEAVLAQLFHPFVTAKKDGTGLGLWISRGIVERYGGRISGRNRPEGGAEFVLRLPCDGAGAGAGSGAAR